MLTPYQHILTEAILTRKIFCADNSMVVSSPPDFLKMLNLGEGSEVVIELDREKGCLIITSVGFELEGVDRECTRRVDAFIGQYRRALEKLAKT